MHLEDEIRKLGLKCLLKKDFKKLDHSVVLYEIFGGEKKLNELNFFLKGDPRVRAYEY